jgi:hypothetical protein
MATYYPQPGDPRRGADPGAQYAELDSREVTAWRSDFDLQGRVRATLKELAMQQGLTRWRIVGSGEQPIADGPVGK